MSRRNVVRHSKNYKRSEKGPFRLIRSFSPFAAFLAPTLIRKRRKNLSSLYLSSSLNLSLSCLSCSTRCFLLLESSSYLRPFHFPPRLQSVRRRGLKRRLVRNRTLLSWWRESSACPAGY